MKLSNGEFNSGDKVIVIKEVGECVWNLYAHKGTIGTVNYEDSEGDIYVTFDGYSATMFKDEIELYETPKNFTDLTPDERKAFIKLFAEKLYTTPSLYSFLKQVVDESSIPGW